MNKSNDSSMLQAAAAPFNFSGASKRFNMLQDINHFDSGYATPGNSFHHSHSTNSLAPISEDHNDENENVMDMELTPTTRNIQKICDFHITTPVASRQHKSQNGAFLKRTASDTFHAKAVAAAIAANNGTPTKTKKMSRSAHATPVKLFMGRRISSMKTSFRKTLSSTPDHQVVDDGFCVEDIENEAFSNELSPIISFSHGKSESRYSMKTPSAEKRTPLRLLSGSRQNSPAFKASCLFTGRNPMASVTKKLSFGSVEVSDITTNNTADPSRRRMPLKRQKAFSSHSSLHVELQQPRPLLPTLPSSPPPEEPQTPLRSLPPQGLASLLSRPIILSGGISSIRAQPPRDTPLTPKKVRRSVSCNQYKFQKEVHETLYPYLPCTPPKNHPRARKRSNNDSKGTPPAKKRLYAQPEPTQKLLPQRKLYYNGREQMDIITGLANLFNVAPAISLILSHLSAPDLNSFSCVNTTWRHVVSMNPLATKRRLKFMTQCQSRKENISRWRQKSIESAPPPQHGDGRRPFSAVNLQKISPLLKTPPVSPSKWRFQENQRIVSRLGENESLKQCPLCGRSAIVDECKTTQQDADDAIPLTTPSPLMPFKNVRFRNLMKMSSCPVSRIASTDVTPRRAFSMDAVPHKAQSSPAFPVARCTNIQCSNVFCVECKNIYETGHKCRVLRVFSPPPKRDIHAVGRRLRAVRKNRRPLERLAF